MRKVLPSLHLYQSLSRVLQEGTGRAYYQRGERIRQGWRNGYEPGRLKRSLRPLEVLIPQIRNTIEPFRSLLMRNFRKGRMTFDSLTLRMYVRGNSVRVVYLFLDAIYLPLHLALGCRESYEAWLIS